MNNLPTLFRLLGLAVLLMVWPVFANAAGLAGARPNIILVMTDDQGYGDIAAHGHPYLKTPNLDKLHAQSTRLEDMHVSATCSPTRAALMTGMYPFKCGVTHTILERERMATTVPTLPEALREAGYATGIFGKWHLGDEEAYWPDQRGFDEVFIHGAGGIGQGYPGSCADVARNKYFDPVIRHNDTFVKTKGFCTDVFFQHALGWIRDRHAAGEPFFAYIPTNAPHSPFICPPRYKAYYDKHAKNGRVAAFYGMIENIDDNMGLLMARLDAWGLADNTLLIYMSDNGSAMGDFSAGMKGKKGSPHEGGTRVPAFWRWPGKIKPGQDIQTHLRHIDYFPTLAAITGSQPPGTVDGRSFLKLLEDPKAAWEPRYTFFHVARWGKDAEGVPDRFRRGDTTPEGNKYRRSGVRDERWRLVGTSMLFDLDNDPGESVNVIEQHPGVARKMLAAYDAWWQEVRPGMINEDLELLDHHPVRVRYETQKRERGIPNWVPPALD